MSFFANSVLGAALGVALARLISQAGVAVAGAVAGRDPVLNHVVTQLRGPGSELVPVFGTIASLLGGVILLMLYPNTKDRSAARLTMLWTLLFAFRNGLADLIVVPLDPDTPIARWLVQTGVAGPIGIVIGVAGAIGLVLVAVGASAAFLGFARHRSEVKNAKERIRFTAALALLPALAGPLLAVPFLIPDGDAGVVSALPTVGLFILITMVAAAGSKSFVAPQVAEERGFSWQLLLGFVIVLLAFRLILAPGILIPPWDENLALHFRP